MAWLLILTASGGGVLGLGGLAVALLAARELDSRAGQRES
jgi:hypothetical protein